MLIRVVLADDHTLVRQGLKALLEREGFQVVGEASDGQEAVRVVPSLRTDVAILDISMPLLNGVDAARELQKASPKTKIILLTRHDEDQYVTESLRAGVKGYVLKSQAATDLVNAIHRFVVEQFISARASLARWWRPIFPRQSFPRTRSRRENAKCFNLSAKGNQPRTLPHFWESA